MTDDDKAHAEKHYGKYSMGYQRGLSKGREERWKLAIENSEMRRFLRDLDDLNCQCDGDLLPSEFAARLRELIGE
jgi:hypothetical protein